LNHVTSVRHCDPAEIQTDPSAGAMKDIPIVKNLHKPQVVTLLPHMVQKYEKMKKFYVVTNMQSAQK